MQEPELHFEKNLWYP